MKEKNVAKYKKAIIEMVEVIECDRALCRIYSFTCGINKLLKRSGTEINKQIRKD